MKLITRLAVALAAVASLTILAGPGRATSATELVVTGSISVGSGMSSGASISLDGSCAGPEATTGPSAHASTCSLTAGGAVRGTCVSSSATVSGSINPSLDVLGGAPQYRTNLTVTLTGAALTITGTAVNGRGETKAVTGAGTVVLSQDDGSTCGDRAHTYDWAGTVTIAG